MLLFVDQPRFIKVMRLEDEDGTIRRVRVGIVQKNKFEISEELRDNLSDAEVAEVEEIIKRYGGVSDAQLKLDLARFPEIVRNVVAHMISGNLDPLEHRLLATALSEGIRVLRKVERNAAEAALT